MTHEHRDCCRRCRWARSTRTRARSRRTRRRANAPPNSPRWNGSSTVLASRRHWPCRRPPSAVFARSKMNARKVTAMLRRPCRQTRSPAAVGTRTSAGRERALRRGRPAYAWALRSEISILRQTCRRRPTRRRNFAANSRTAPQLRKSPRRWTPRAPDMLKVDLKGQATLPSGTAAHSGAVGAARCSRPRACPHFRRARSSVVTIKGAVVTGAGSCADAEARRLRPRSRSPQRKHRRVRSPSSLPRSATPTMPIVMVGGTA